MNLVDKELRCFDCGAGFVFSAAEQEFFKYKGFENEPKHCKQCKAKRQKGIVRAVETRIKCSECGAETTVPFKPTQNWPVLCRGCFAKHAENRTAQVALIR
ncbi:MAG: zinc-ribbon domain containing protein [Terracidiphilus sp.]